MYLAVLVTTSTPLPLIQDCSQERQGPGGHAGSSDAVGDPRDSSGNGDRAKRSEVTPRSPALASTGENHEVKGDEQQLTSLCEALGSPDKCIERRQCPLSADCAEGLAPSSSLY